jgi:hypothetical protein
MIRFARRYGGQVFDVPSMLMAVLFGLPKSQGGGASPTQIALRRQFFAALWRLDDIAKTRGIEMLDALADLLAPAAAQDLWHLGGEATFPASIHRYVILPPVNLIYSGCVTPLALYLRERGLALRRLYADECESVSDCLNR